MNVLEIQKFRMAVYPEYRKTLAIYTIQRVLRLSQSLRHVEAFT